LLRGIKAKFKAAKYAMPAANERQAFLVRGARPIDNANGTAPGQWIELAGEQAVVLLPGPPTEMQPMVEKYVLPLLKKRFPSRPRASAHLHFVGLPESVVDDRVRPLVEKASRKLGSDVQFTILAHLGLVDLDIFVTADKAAKAKSMLNDLVRGVREAVGDDFYGMNEDYPLERVVGNVFRKKKMTLSLAESCTGGMLASRLTDIPGSSDFLLGSVVSYSNEVKSTALGVVAELIRTHGAVSKEVAVAMADGVRRATGSTYSLGVTGIAGPGGATASKPVGLVYIAVSGPEGTKAYEYRYKGSRDVIRQRAVTQSLDLLRRLE
jgi:nicotinamide-nucleotide amidase